MLDYISVNELSHFEVMSIFLIILSVIFVIMYIVDKKKNISNEDILKKRL